LMEATPYMACLFGLWILQLARIWQMNRIQLLK